MNRDRDVSALLDVSSVSKFFGGLQALNQVSLQVEKAEFVGLIGPNGSGKTTLLNVISGFLNVDSGMIRLRGASVNGRSPVEIAHRGIGRTFQVTKVFHRMSVLENMLVPMLSKGNASWREATNRAEAILEQLSLGRLKNHPAGDLSGGQQKLLEFGIVMMLDPPLLLLDEPFAGVHPELKRTMHDYLLWMHRSSKKAILLVSHDMTSVFDLCERVVVLNKGARIADGIPGEVRKDAGVLEAYLGDEVTRVTG